MTFHEFVIRPVVWGDIIIILCVIGMGLCVIYAIRKGGR